MEIQEIILFFFLILSQSNLSFIILHRKIKKNRNVYKCPCTIYKLILYDIFYFINCYRIQNIYPIQPFPYLKLLLLLSFYYKHTVLANE